MYGHDLNRSSFSYVPALFMPNDTVVVYPARSELLGGALPTWQVAEL